ncbi:hypothetical protein [Ponticoccus alexandrii]|uniref:hypothetical protein n=1 Tax=Ponticoccus alexandrii TaxID=1943633 RepID=UPI0003D1BC25|nr:hypothetical protein [Ponticoccus alexandrii]
MDNLVSRNYLLVMLARIMTLLAILAITVVTTVASAHAARMDNSEGHAMSVGEMVITPTTAAPSCEIAGPCDSTSAELCEFVCAGFMAFLIWPPAADAHAYVPSRHGFSAEASHVSRAPALSERPPKLRLL